MVLVATLQFCGCCMQCYCHGNGNSYISSSISYNGYSRGSVKWNNNCDVNGNGNQTHSESR